MLIKLFSQLDAASLPSLTVRCNGRRVDAFGAVAHGARLALSMSVPRSLGASAVVLRLAPDGGEHTDLPLEFVSSEAGADLYTVTLDTARLAPAGDGLFYFEFLFLRGLDTLFSTTADNLHFALADHSAGRFRLLVYRADFHTPAWFQGATMYHVFVDRFCRGRGEVSLHGNAVIDPDWENGIPQFAPKPGDPLSNNIFFGGNLWGVAEQLDRLCDMGITVLYLSPIFKAASNHRYDTGDYETVDPLLGGDAALDHLIAEAHRRGMKIILDGVFNHTGDDSRYFNRCTTYPDIGAYQSKRSPYYPWFSFSSYPNEYECWWGVEIMPRLNHQNPDCRRYFTGKEGIISKWLARGIDGWRLDVADELPDSFLDELRETVKAKTNGEGVIIGEVWENAADKISYGYRRRYLRGQQLDSVMNYPFRNAVLALLKDKDVNFFVQVLTEIYTSYPPEVCMSLMNLLGTHDTPRILTLLGDDTMGEGLSNAELAVRRLSESDRARAVKLLKLASTLQFTVYGVPSVYYGDEAGLEGYHDPFCRMPYPYGRENAELLEHYRSLGALRKAHPALRTGSFRFLSHSPTAFSFERSLGSDRVVVSVDVETMECVVEGSRVSRKDF